MKDVLHYMKSLSSDPSDALKKKIFALTTTRPNATRKKRGEKEALFICFASIQFYVSVFVVLVSLTERATLIMVIAA